MHAFCMKHSERQSGGSVVGAMVPLRPWRSLTPKDSVTRTSSLSFGMIDSFALPVV
ncbi:hypothetical protein EGYY_24790 [Eggerthella sp. YY7918]|nr:hypothetical protein EGYY_24790 [Eggerthella sp. YY7918]